MPAEPCPVPSLPTPYDYNIAFFTNTFLPFVGGVSNSINLYATHLERLGQHILIYAPSYPDAQEDSNHQPGGSNVLYLDGHVAYVPWQHGGFDAQRGIWRDGNATPPVLPSIARTVGALGAARQATAPSPDTIDFFRLVVYDSH